MTIRTFDDIVTEGMLKAGRDDLADRIRGYFNDWLGRQARSWPWPTLTTVRQVALAAGTNVYTLTPPNGEVWSRIIGETWLFNAQGTRQRVDVRQLTGTPVGLLAAGTGMSNRGIPTNGAYYKNDNAPWTVDFDKTLDRDVTWLSNVVLVPARIAAPWTSVPWYPEDDTCIEACALETLRFTNGPDDSSVQAQMAVVEGMVTKDRMRHGVSPGQNDVLLLDKGVFR